MNAEIIAVGSELLLGQIANTNGQYISKQLASVGVDVYSHTVVGDNEDRLFKTISEGFARADLLILTGGLGPTKDDLTKDTVAKFCERKLVYDQEALDHIEAYFKRHNRTMTPNNKKQAYVIEGAHVLANRHGMAPGMVVQLANEKRIVLLPGPPSEMKPMFEKELLPFLLGANDQASITSRVLHFFGIGESQLETDLEDIIENQQNPTIAPLASDGEVKLRLTVKHTDENEIKRLLDETESVIMDRVGDYLYGYDETTLVKEVSRYLDEQGLTVACAESFTGGLFASELVSLPGASSILTGSITAYTEEAKTALLGVSQKTLQDHGVVSEACAAEMAQGIQERLQTDVAISFTGVAGPEKQGDIEPGTVVIGIAFPQQPVRTIPLSLSGGRNAVRMRAVKYGFFYLLDELKRRNGNK